MTGIQHALLDLLHEHLADGVIEQGIFVYEVLVKSGAVDLSFGSHILHRNGFEILLSEEISKSLQDQLSYPTDSVF
jgi:hypothetical protein